METKVEAIPSQADQKLQQEFNQWAAAGRGDEMEDHHSNILDQTLSLMDLQPADRVLDLGCGTGWASRRMARLAGEVVGLDVADEMLRRAEQASASITNVRYVWGSAEKILLFALDERWKYKALLAKHGFSNVQARRIPDRSPSPETYSGKWFKYTEELRDFKRIGALLLIAAK